MPLTQRGREMLEQFTPGPWAATKYKDTKSTTIYANGGKQSLGNIKSEADANLIAAAPDLYAALEKTLAYLRADEDCDDIAEIEERINEALSKARGEQ